VVAAHCSSRTYLITKRVPRVNVQNAVLRLECILSVKGSDANDRTEADALAVRRDAVQRQSSLRREVSLVLIGRPRLQFPVLIIPRAML
jgi:hypothetical protein